MAVDKLVDSTQLNTDLTSVANAIRAKSGGSNQLAFPSGFVSEIANIPSGGSGLTTIASGTFTGTGAYDIPVNIGKKMPKTDFFVRYVAKSDSEFTYDTNYKPAVVEAVIFSEDGYFDLSSDGDGKTLISNITYDINNSGTVTPTAATQPYAATATHVRNASVGNYGRPNNFKINKKSDHFEVRLFNSNAQNAYPNGITYDWKIVYFGSNPSTDIIEIT